MLEFGEFTHFQSIKSRGHGLQNIFSIVIQYSFYQKLSNERIEFTEFTSIITT